MYDKYLKVKSSKNGLGVFTTIPIPANTAIAEPFGQVLTLKELPNPNDPAILQIGPNTYMLGTGVALPDFINHSCDPNCYFHIVGNRAILFSLYVISAGAELTFDYSTTCNESVDMWKMYCQCGSSKCRGLVSGFQYLDAKTQDDYKKKNMVPLYISTTLFQPR